MTITTHTMTVTAPNAEETMTGQDKRAPLTGGIGPVAVRVFPGLAAQVPHARRWVRALASRPGREPGRTDLVDDLELIAAELFANAVLHTRSGGGGGTVTVAVTADWVIHVHDQGAGGPCPGLLAVGGGVRDDFGRGLQIVMAISGGLAHLPAAWCPVGGPDDPAIGAGGCCTCCRPAVGPPAPPVPSQEQRRPATREGSILR
jgi:anti-sigma regulatory factor (Ser/Thr protein kinase)